MSDQAFMNCIAKLVPEGSRVLDLGCGDGSLLSYLQREKNCRGYGVEINDQNVLSCVQKGVQVIQLNLDEGLTMFADQSFDMVLQIDTLQHLRNAETMLQETIRVAKQGVVTFPNFAHWPNRLSILFGHLPVTKRLPYEWYDTPNIRVGTFTDFERLARKNNIEIVESFGINDAKTIRVNPNLRAPTAVFKIKKY